MTRTNQPPAGSGVADGAQARSGRRRSRGGAARPAAGGTAPPTTEDSAAPPPEGEARIEDAAPPPAAEDEESRQLPPEAGTPALPASPDPPLAAPRPERGGGMEGEGGEAERASSPPGTPRGDTF